MTLTLHVIGVYCSSLGILQTEGELTSLVVEIKGAPYYLPVGEARPKLDHEKPIVILDDIIHRVN